MSDLNETLSSRLEATTPPAQPRNRILSTTGTRAAVEALAARTEALEEAVRELSEIVQAMVDTERQSTFQR